MTADQLILQHRQKLSADGAHGPWLALFDIDSTLMDTAPRNLAILEAAFHQLPALRDWQGRLDLDPRAWNIVEPLRRAGLADETVLAQVGSFWRDRFFTDDWLSHDRPYPGVPEFLHRLQANGFQLAYLTGRHSDGMEIGTRLSFQQHGLPAGPEVDFFFKPDFHLDDAAFKASVCDQVAQLGTLVFALDNEPANVNLLARAFPHALVGFLDTITSPQPEPLQPTIPRFGLDFFSRGAF